MPSVRQGRDKYLFKSHWFDSTRVRGSNNCSGGSSNCSDGDSSNSSGVIVAGNSCQRQEFMLCFHSQGHNSLKLIIYLSKAKEKSEQSYAHVQCITAHSDHKVIQPSTGSQQMMRLSILAPY